MEILKHTFEIPKLGVVNGDIVELDPERVTCSFALTIKALELFEEEYGEPIINVLFGNNNGEVTTGRFVRALACSMYLKIADGQILQNEATKEEFQNLEIYQSVASDLTFTANLVTTAVKSIEEKTKKDSANNKQVKN